MSGVLLGYIGTSAMTQDQRNKIHQAQGLLEEVLKELGEKLRASKSGTTAIAIEYGGISAAVRALETVA